MGDIWNPRTDIDLYVYPGDNPTEYFHPSFNNRNHVGNVRESLIISNHDIDDQYENFRYGPFYIVELYASPDGATSVMKYKIGIKDNYKMRTLKFASWMPFVAALLAFTVTLLTVFYRRRWFWMLEGR